MIEPEHGAFETQEQLAKKRRFAVVGTLLALAVVLAIGFAFAQGVRHTNGLKDQIQTIQALVTTLGILIAGVWAFYVFVLQRRFAANVQFQIALKAVTHSSEKKEGKFAILSIQIENTGPIRVWKDSCRVGVMPAISDQDSRMTDPNELFRLDSPFDLRAARTYSVLTDHLRFEPGERAVEDILFAVGQYKLLKVRIRFIDQRVGWLPSVQRIILGGDLEKQM